MAQQDIPSKRSSFTLVVVGDSLVLFGGSHMSGVSLTLLPFPPFTRLPVNAKMPCYYAEAKLPIVV
jgi:hypothetical protein